MDLFLIRHAVPENPGERWSDDAQRPLTPAGHKAFQVFVSRDPRLAGGVDLVASSPYVRAQQTADILSESLRWPAPQTWPQLRPESDPRAVLKRLPSARRVALVTHQPLVSRLAALLVPEADGVSFEPGTIAHFEWDPTAPSARLRWCAAPPRR